MILDKTTAAAVQQVVLATPSLNVALRRLCLYEYLTTVAAVPLCQSLPWNFQALSVEFAEQSGGTNTSVPMNSRALDTFLSLPRFYYSHMPLRH